MKIKKYKPKFAVFCRVIDCQDDLDLMFLLGDDNPKVFDTRCAARKAMRRDYRMSVYLSESGKDTCVVNVLPDEISLDVPIYKSYKGRESIIRVRWKVVSI